MFPLLANITTFHKIKDITMCFKCAAKQKHIDFLNFKFDTLVKHGRGTGNLVRLDGMNAYHEKLKQTDLPISKLTARIKEDPELEGLVKAYALRAELVFAMYLESGNKLPDIVDSLIQVLGDAIESNKEESKNEAPEFRPS